MKKYLTLALLTCAGVNSLRAAEVPKNPTPAEALTYATVAATRPLSKRAQRQQARKDTAPVYTQISMGTDDEYTVANNDGSSFSLTEQELGQTRILTTEAKKQILEAQRLSEQEAELKRQKEEYIEKLKASLKTIESKIADAEKIVGEKAGHLKIHEASAAEAEKFAAEKARHADELQEKFEAVKVELDRANQELASASQISQDKGATTLARSQSFKGHDVRLKTLQEEAASIRAQLGESQPEKTLTTEVQTAGAQSNYFNGFFALLFGGSSDQK